jgi:hypothetical protein
VNGQQVFEFDGEEVDVVGQVGDVAESFEVH